MPSRTLAKVRLVLRHANESNGVLKIDQRNMISGFVSPKIENLATHE